MHVTINAVTRVDATIEVGAVNGTGQRGGDQRVLQTTKSDVSVSLDTRAMENLPLSGYRNYQSLINLVPGATPARFQNAVTDTPGRALSTNVNGQERGANNTRVDGSADILVTMPHHAVYVPPVESIQEVNISTNSFDAEQGMTGGAAVTSSRSQGQTPTAERRSRCTQRCDACVHVGREPSQCRRQARGETKHQRKQLKKGSVTRDKISNGAVNGAKVATTR